MKQKQKQKHMLQLHEQKAESFQCFSGIETETNCFTCFTRGNKE